MRKLLLALCALTVTVFGQSAPPCPTVDVEGKCLIAGPVKPSESTAPKPPDAVIAAWYKATSAEAAGKAAYAVLMDQIKKAVDEFVSAKGLNLDLGDNFTWFVKTKGD
jgi:hypothetical protein